MKLLLTDRLAVARFQSADVAIACARTWSHASIVGVEGVKCCAVVKPVDGES